MSTAPARRPVRDDELVVGRVGRAHGVHGDCAVEPRTDAVETRFAPGVRLRTDGVAPEPEALEVHRARDHSGRLVVGFRGVRDRVAAEALRGLLLLVDVADRPVLHDPEEFWDVDLVGLRAVGPDGAELGVVSEVLHPPGGDLLVLARPGRDDGLVPFVAAVVPEVDVAGGRVVVDAPPGLLDDDHEQGR